MWTLSCKLTSWNPSVPSHQLESSHVSPRVILPHMKTILLVEAINDCFSACLFVWNLQWSHPASPGQARDSGKGQLRGGGGLFTGARHGAHTAPSFCADSNEREAKSALGKNLQETRVGEKPVKRAENKNFPIVSCHPQFLGLASLSLSFLPGRMRDRTSAGKLKSTLHSGVCH